MENNKQVTEDMKPQKEWFDRAKNIETPEQLAEFAKELLIDIQHDYGTVCHAVGAIALAGAWLGAHIQGITGFQAVFVMYDFVRNWNFSTNQCGLRIIDYDNMLYPQYKDKFDKTITKERFEIIQKEASRLLETSRNAHPDVINHWKSIVDGNLPFGYSNRHLAGLLPVPGRYRKRRRVHLRLCSKTRSRRS